MSILVLPASSRKRCFDGMAEDAAEGGDGEAILVASFFRSASLNQSGKRQRSSGAKFGSQPVSQSTPHSPRTPRVGKKRSFIAEEEEQRPYGSEPEAERAVMDHSDAAAGSQSSVGQPFKRNKAEFVIFGRDGDYLSSPTGVRGIVTTQSPDEINVDYASSNSFLRDLHFMRGRRHGERRETFEQSLVSVPDAEGSTSSAMAMDLQLSSDTPSAPPPFLLGTERQVSATPLCSVLRDLPRMRKWESDYLLRQQREREDVETVLMTDGIARRTPTSEGTFHSPATRTNSGPFLLSFRNQPDDEHVT